MTQKIPAKCDSCIHRTGPARCVAFRRIPDSILVWGDDHSEPLPDQGNSVVWKLDPDKVDELKTWKRTHPS